MLTVGCRSFLPQAAFGQGVHLSRGRQTRTSRFPSVECGSLSDSTLGNGSSLSPLQPPCYLAGAPAPPSEEPLRGPGPCSVDFAPCLHSVQLKPSPVLPSALPTCLRIFALQLMLPVLTPLFLLFLHFLEILVFLPRGTVLLSPSQPPSLLHFLLYQVFRCREFILFSVT